MGCGFAILALQTTASSYGIEEECNSLPFWPDPSLGSSLSILLPYFSHSAFNSFPPSTTPCPDWSQLLEYWSATLPHPPPHPSTAPCPDWSQLLKYWSVTLPHPPSHTLQTGFFQSQRPSKPAFFKANNPSNRLFSKPKFPYSYFTHSLTCATHFFCFANHAYFIHASYPSFPPKNRLF